MLQEEKHLKEEKKGDEMTEGDQNYGAEEFDLEKFHHGVHFGPEDYQNDPDIPDHLLFDEKEFIGMGGNGGGGLQQDLNDPSNQGSSGMFESSDNQLMEIIRNKKKPTARVNIEKKRMGDLDEDIAGLGMPKEHKVRGLEDDELGVRNFNRKKKGGKDGNGGVNNGGLQVPQAEPLGVATKNKNRPTKEDGSFGNDDNELGVVNRNKQTPKPPVENVGDAPKGGSNKGGLPTIGTVDTKKKGKAGPLDDL
jgi:hypothetical protein